ncbi:chitin synthase III catalytic subunit [Dimargaris cristalligena]|uniref:Chitin synthase III catalytic subunit n=1 Tax=Dimargaris cristalligena TaxID=215637 RepID=A0A4Q0A2P9_9FUNG|nr:chitin synthase III catalytic subunit [Dimargaris cristalligena]|eukprot:RKP40416.1 chitin synthase III catalytic subunit [Dimargaris cristalligena]
MQYGSLQEFCAQPSSPICNIFALRPPAKCIIMGESISGGTVRLVNIGDFVISTLSIIIIAYVCFRIKGKLSGVGRQEFSYIYLLYTGVLVCQILSIDWYFKDVSPWIACIHVALTIATFWCLLLNALIAFQIFPDGSRVSLTVLLMSTFLVFVGSLYITLDTRIGLTSALLPLDGRGGLVSPALFTLYITFPLVAISVYLFCQTLLVLWFLTIRRPLAFLYGSLVCFVLGQVFLLLVSQPLCESSNESMDALMFTTAFNTTSLCLLYIYWAAVTAGKLCGQLVVISLVPSGHVGKWSTLDTYNYGHLWLITSWPRLIFRVLPPFFLTYVDEWDEYETVQLKH